VSKVTVFVGLNDPLFPRGRRPGDGRSPPVDPGLAAPEKIRETSPKALDNPQAFREGGGSVRRPVLSGTTITPRNTGAIAFRQRIRGDSGSKIAASGTNLG
jgi:hypothetical protein